MSTTLVESIKFLFADLVVPRHVNPPKEGFNLMLADLDLILSFFVGVSFHCFEHGLDLAVGQYTIVIGVEGIEVFGK